MSRLFRSCCGRPQDDTHDISFSAETSIELLERLRAAANSSGSWLSRADRMLSELTAALAPSAHASLMGASSCAGSLVLLGCGAPGPGVPVSLGLSLPSPWHTHNDKVPRKLTWQRCPVRQTGPRKPPLHQHSQSDRLPDSWLQLLPHDSKGQPALDPSAGALVPIIIGGRLAGALLVWEWESSPLVLTAPAKAASGLAQETATAEAASRVTAAVIRPGSLLEKDEQPRTSSARAASAEGLRPSGLPAGCSSLLRIPVALAAVVGVVRDCLLAPHLDEIRLVCAAAHELAHAPNIPTIATVLSTTVSSFLSATLHCDLSVRPALVPSPASSTSVQYGFLLQERLGATAMGAAVGGLSHPASSLPQDLEDPYGGNGAGGRLTGLVTRTNSCGVLRSSALMRSRSFLLSCAEEASDGESSTALKSSAGLAFPYSGGGRDGGAGVTGSPFEGVPRRTGNRWKAVPFALPTALLGELLRPDYHSSRASSTLTPRSSLPSGSVASSANAGSFKRLLSCPMNDPPTPLTRGNGGSDSSTTADGGGRLTAVVLPDLHQYLQDVHRPSGDVLLLFTSQRRTATNLSNSATANAASSSGSVSAPACLVLLATSAAATRTGGPGRAQSAVEDTSCGKRNSTHAGVGSSLPSMQPSQPPVRTPTGLEEPSYTPPRVALYVSSQDRLPGSLLTAARDASREVLQVLLPSTLLGLTRGTAAAELQEIAALMEARGQPGTAAVPAGPSRDVTAPGTTRSSAPIRPYRATGPQPRAPPSPTPQQPPPLFEHNPQQHSQNNTLDDDGAVTVLHTPTRSVVCSPPAVLPLPCTTLSPISRISTGAGVTTSGGSATPSRWLLEALLRSGSSGGKKTRQRQQAYLSRHSRVCRNMSASDLLPAASAPPEIAPPPVAVAQALLTTTNSAAMPGLERSPRQNVGGRMSSAAVVGVSGGLVASRGELLDLECMTGRLGTDPLLPELPAMRLLLTSFFSTLNDTEADPSPHAADDLRCLRLTRVIGDGGCSIVYGGLLHGLDVAVKVLHPLQPMVTEEDVTGDLLGEGCSTSRPPGGGDGDVMVTAGLAGIGMGGGYEVPAARGQPMWAVARQARLRELMRGVRELAVMSAISHPNIVQVYSYHTQVRMVAAASPGGLPTLVPMATDDGHVMADADETHVVIIMERCDVGSLADALDSGLFERAVRQAAAAAERGDTPGRRAVSGAMRHPLAATTCASSGQGGGTSGSSHGGSGPVPTRHASLTSLNTASGGSRMRGIYLTLLEVALALRHLHSKNVAHCDVKAANILLKSSPNDPRGFTCKLGDFGLVGVVRKEVGDGCEHPAGQEGPVGTVTHLAPEYYTPGTKLDSSVDVYAFGIVMWEVYTGKPPFSEFAATHFEDLPYKVVHERLRPRWPRGTPSPYRALASACWAADPATRPTAAVLVTSLQQLMESS